jgi:hypothetical protein
MGDDFGHIAAAADLHGLPSVALGDGGRNRRRRHNGANGQSPQEGVTQDILHEFHSVGISLSQRMTRNGCPAAGIPGNERHYCGPAKDTDILEKITCKIQFYP